MTHLPRRSLGVLIPDGDRLSVVRLVRRRGRLCADAQASLRLQANFLGDAADVVAAELESQLSEQGFHETRWLLAVPPSWLASVRVPFPGAAVDGMLDYAWLQAEQQLAVVAAQTVLAVSPDTAATDKASLTVFAMKAERLTRIAAILQAARMHLVAALPAVILPVDSAPASVHASLCAFSSRYVLQVTLGTRVLLLREVAVDTESSPAERHRALRPAVRIALASLPESRRTELTAIDLIAEPRRAEALLSAWREAELSGTAADHTALTHRLSAEAGLGLMAEGLAHTIGRTDTALCFEPRRLVSEGGPRRRLLLRAALLGIVLLAALLIWLLTGVVRMRALQKEAATLQPRRTVVETMRQQVRFLSTWYDRTPTSLDILKAVTEVFPEQGTVWTTGLTISADRTVNLVGKTTDQAAWLSMQEALRRCPNIQDLRISQTRSERNERGAMTFLMTFKWSRKAAS